jgi:hypothetical protein
MKTGALLLVLGAWAAAQGADISVRGGVLRVEKNSQIRMTDDQVELTSGTLTFQVQDADAAQVEILTPSVSVKAYAEGVYRISVRKTGESEITAQSGRIVVMAPGGEQWLEAGQKMIARGPRANPQFRIVSAVAWWRRLASLLQNMQIGGGVSAGSGGGEEQSATAKDSRTKPHSENAAIPAGSAHSSENRPKTSDSHSNTSGGSAHSGDSRPAASGGSGSSSHSSESHSAPASSSGSHSSESHAAPASSSGGSHSSDNAAKGK